MREKIKHLDAEDFIAKCVESFEEKKSFQEPVLSNSLESIDVDGWILAMDVVIPNLVSKEE